MWNVGDGWRQCYPGELDRLEARLKSTRQQKKWGNVLAIFALSGIIAFCTWQAASALLPSILGSGGHGGPGCGSTQPRDPNECSPCTTQ